MIPAELLWPKRPPNQLQTFFIRVATGEDRDAIYKAAARALRATRFRDFGTLVLRAPRDGAWFVVDWVGPFELSDEVMRAVSAELKTEVLGLGMTVAHGRAGDDVHVHRFQAGASAAGQRVETHEDHLTPVIGDALRLPSSIHVDDLGAAAAALQLPSESTLQGGPRVEIRCVPGRLLFWVIVLVAGASAVLLFT